MAFLSVVIPVYNAEKYLEICFKSIMSQTFTDYEVIIIDDGSKDKSGVICDEYASKDGRVRVFHIENSGPSQARNIGLKKAIGEYIYCIDNDDYISSIDYFEKIYISLNDNPVDVLQTGATYYRENNNKVSRFVDYKDISNVDIFKPYDTIYLMISKRIYETSCWTKIIKRKFLVENEFYFKPELLVEDLDWNMRFFQKINTYNLLKIADYVHVYHLGSITSGNDEKGYKICMDQIYTIQKWGKYYGNYDGSEVLKKATLSYLSYQFFITMGKASTLGEKWKDKVKMQLRNIDFIAKYAIEKKQKVLSVIYRMFGLDITLKLINIYYTKFRTKIR